MDKDKEATDNVSRSVLDHLILNKRSNRTHFIIKINSQIKPKLAPHYEVL